MIEDDYTSVPFKPVRKIGVKYVPAPDLDIGTPEDGWFGWIAVVAWAASMILAFWIGMSL